MNPQLTEEKKQNINTTLDQVRARAMELSGLQPNIKADQLTQPVQPLTVPTPATPTIPKRAGQLVSNITRDTAGFITAQTEEAKQLKELQATYGQMNEQGSLSDLYNSTLKDAGITGESFKELKDIQLQLNDMDTSSELTKTKIAGAAGQTLDQAQREVTQEDRENAVRSAGLAARAAVLQGNIETARAAASEAVNIAFQDRTLTAQNLINQIEMVQGRVDEQTAQLLETEKRAYEADLAAIEEAKSAVTEAIASGGASQREIAIMTDPNLPDDQRLALAQQIVGRTASADRALERANLQSQIAARASEGNIYNTLNGKEQNATQATANGYADRLLQADRIINSIGGQFASPTAFGGYLPNFLQSGERQQFEQAKRNFINAVLRRESGAVISPEEFKNADKQYFPQPGDVEDTLLQKATNRNTAIDNLYREANTFRPVMAGDIIEADGKRYRVGTDGLTLEEI